MGLAPRTAQAPYAAGPLLGQQGLGGYGAQGNQRGRVNKGDLPVQEGQAEGDFGFGRVAVAGRAPGHGVDDADFGAVQPYGPEHTVQQLPGGAHKGAAGAVFLGAGSLADDDEAGIIRAIGENKLGGGVAQGAAGKAVHGLAQLVQALAGGGQARGLRRAGRHWGWGFGGGARRWWRGGQGRGGCRGGNTAVLRGVKQRLVHPPFQLQAQSFQHVHAGMDIIKWLAGISPICPAAIIE